MLLRVLMLALLAATPLWAHGFTLGALEIDHPALAITGGPTAAGYMTITNRGDQDDRLLAVTSGGAVATLHLSTVSDDGVARMEAMDQGIDIPAGASVVLEPGGLHVMFEKPATPLVAGATVPATLVFEKAGSIDVEFRVEKSGTGHSHTNP